MMSLEEETMCMSLPEDQFNKVTENSLGAISQLDGIKFTTVSHFSILGFTYKYTDK